MWRRVVPVLALALLAACQDPLARHSIYGGLAPFDPPSGELVRVLDTASDTPARQGLLYIAMQDAEFAAQYAGRALARLNEPGETEQAIGEAMYAVAPAEAPTWEGKEAGYDPGWPSRGYGLRRALDAIAGDLAVAERASSSAALRAEAPRVLQCTRNTIERTDRVLALGRQALAAGTDADAEGILRQLIEVATALNRGVPSPGEGGCGLEEVQLRLDRVAPNPS